MYLAIFNADEVLNREKCKQIDDITLVAFRFKA
jgi:hypothetical protein